MNITTQTLSYANRPNRAALASSSKTGLGSNTEAKGSDQADQVSWSSRSYGSSRGGWKKGLAAVGGAVGMGALTHMAASTLTGTAASVAGALGAGTVGVAAGSLAGIGVALALTEDKSGFGGIASGMLGAAVGGVTVGAAGAYFGAVAGLNPGIAVAGGLVGGAVAMALTKS